MPNPTDLISHRLPNLSQSIEERVITLKKIITEDPNYDGWDTSILKDVVLTKVSTGRTEWELTVKPSMCNKSMTLHGGCSATLLDTLTSSALLTLAKPGFLDGGHVSRTITMTYLRALPVGTKVRVICDAISGGRTLAHCRGQIETEDGKVAVTCVHDKAVVPRAKL